MSSFFGRMMFGLGRGVRETGQALDRVGCKIQGNLAFVEELSRHRRLAPLYDKWPSVGKKVFIAPNASVIGDVQIRDGASVWYGAVLRGDVNSISIGANTTIGEDSVVHVAGGNVPGTEARAAVVGDDVVVDPGAVIHACEVKDGAWVQSGSILLDGSVLGKGSILGPGSLLTGKTVPDGEYWAGSPAVKVRDVNETDAQVAAQRRAAISQLAAEHDHEHLKTAEQRHHSAENYRPPNFGKGVQADH